MECAKDAERAVSQGACELTPRCSLRATIRLRKHMRLQAARTCESAVTHSVCCRSAAVVCVGGKTHQSRPSNPVSTSQWMPTSSVAPKWMLIFADRPGSRKDLHILWAAPDRPAGPRPKWMWVSDCLVAPFPHGPAAAVALSGQRALALHGPQVPHRPMLEHCAVAFVRFAARQPPTMELFGPAARAALMGALKCGGNARIGHPNAFLTPRIAPLIIAVARFAAFSRQQRSFACFLPGHACDAHGAPDPSNGTGSRPFRAPRVAGLPCPLRNFSTARDGAINLLLLVAQSGGCGKQNSLLSCSRRVVFSRCSAHSAAGEPQRHGPGLHAAPPLPVSHRGGGATSFARRFPHWPGRRCLSSDVWG